MPADLHLELLRKIDRQVEGQGTSLDEIRRDLADGRERFARAEGRMDLIEQVQRDQGDRIKESVREAFAEQRETTALEAIPAAKPSATGLIAALGKLGTWAKPIVAVGLLVGGCIAGYLAARPSAPPAPTTSTQAHP